ncbi:MAG: exonuclease SbcCD subunit D [Ruminococcus sp.]|jgi:exonuclease SbcD|nr:exonuclease SbcCD subunit D [Ruminococcus sp.]
MKLFHISDLHLGKKLFDYSLTEDQEYILNSILNLAAKEKPEAVLISGDVFDRNVAPTEALRLFEDFLSGLVTLKIRAFIISGNHDSADRLAFGSRLFGKSGVYISKVFDGKITPFTIYDEYGEINVYLMPFLKTSHVKRYFGTDVNNISDAVKTVVDSLQIDRNARNILLAHQFVTGGVTSGSEESSVGGTDNVDAACFTAFDYVALGHLHGSQSINNTNIRYSGSPLKYSFSESAKSVTAVELAEKGRINIREIPLVPKREMVKIKGLYLKISARDFYKNLNRDDYFHITLTDEEDMPDALGKLRACYPNLMRLEYDNKRTKAGGSVSGDFDAAKYSPIDLFEMLFKKQNGKSISPAQRVFTEELIKEVWEE